MCATIAVAAAAALTSTACRTQPPRPDGRTPLRRPTSDTPPADYQPAIPFTELAPNVLSRTLYSSQNGTEYAVTSQELAIPPQKAIRDLKMNGAAIFQLRDGTASVRIGNQTRAISPGETFLVADGDSVTVESAADVPVFFNVHVVKMR